MSDWVDELRQKLDRVEKADERLSEAMETDSLPMEACAASEARADLWEFMVWIVKETDE